MTENEAKVFIHNAMIQSKKALAELLLIAPKVFAAKKKSLGEYYSNLENCKKEIQACEVAVNALEEIQQYHAIGTVEECRAAVEKQKPKKPRPIDYKSYVEVIENADFLRGTCWCPNCSHTVKCGSFCQNCGQKLDWSGEE